MTLTLFQAFEELAKSSCPGTVLGHGCGLGADEKAQFVRNSE